MIVGELAIATSADGASNVLNLNRYVRQDLLTDVMEALAADWYDDADSTIPSNCECPRMNVERLAAGENVICLRCGRRL